MSEEGELLISLGNYLTMQVLKGDELWWYVISAPGTVEDCVVSQYHAPTREEARLAGLACARLMARQIEERVAKELGEEVLYVDPE